MKGITIASFSGHSQIIVLDLLRVKCELGLAWYGMAHACDHMRHVCGRVHGFKLGVYGIDKFIASV